jgi:hypothetical protein
MARPHRLRDPVDCLAVGDVARLGLTAQLGRERAQAFLAPREEYGPEAASGERARDRLADPARRAGDDGYARVRQLPADPNDPGGGRGPPARVAEHGG